MVILRQNVAELFDSVSALCTFMQYSITFCSRPEAASEVMSFVSHTVYDIAVKFCDPGSIRYREIRLRVVGEEHFDSFPR